MPKIHSWTVPCSKQYEESGYRAGCHPKDECARHVVDDFVTDAEAEGLLRVDVGEVQNFVESDRPTVLASAQLSTPRTIPARRKLHWIT